MGLVVVVALGAAIFFWNDARTARNESPEGIAARNQEESERVITSLDTVLLTESDAAPTVARVEDPEVLKQANEDFYKNAETGDYLVLYPQRAILYREVEKRIINVAPIINTDQLRGGSNDTAPSASDEGVESTQ